MRLPAKPLHTGVLLLNLGGPESLESVEPYLENLFRDPFLI
ncbi:MAG: ferrochelatase, partial [Deltaproteobacteria bacterium]